MPFITAPRKRGKSDPDEKVGESSISRAQEIADKIENDIVNARLAPGVLMGTKEHLCIKYQVSATHLRQAARILEQRGIASLRRGSGGGLVVRRQGLKVLSKAVATYLEFIACPFEDTLLLNECVRPFVNEIASTAMTLERARELAQTFDKLKLHSHSALNDINRLTEFLNSLFDLSSNPAVALIHQTLSYFYTDIIPYEEESVELKQSMRDEQILMTEEILSALIACDLSKLQQLSSAFNQRMRELHDLWPSDRLALLQPGSQQSESLVLQKGQWNTKTLAEGLARLILRDIRLQGWPVGKHLGSEPELLERFSVSRATFRQAVRILEEYSAAKMKRGTGGGLVVTSPDSNRIVEAAIHQLQAEGVECDELRQIQCSLCTLAIELCCKSDFSDELSDLVLAMEAFALNNKHNIRDQIASVQIKIAQACGNDAVAVFLHIFAPLSSARDIPYTIADEVVFDIAHKSFSAIAEAVKHKKPAFARRALLEYFERETLWIQGR